MFWLPTGGVLLRDIAYTLFIETGTPHTVYEPVGGRERERERGRERERKRERETILWKGANINEWK